MEKIKRTKQKSNIKSTSGITLLSLAVTIIIMIILAFITINLTIGEQGIFKHGQQANVDYKIAKYVEDVEVTRGDVAVDNLGRVTLDNLIKRIEEKNIFAEGKITKINEEKAEAITKEGYVIIITATDTKYDRTEKVEEIPELKEGNIVISFEPEDWTKENVTVSIQNNVEGSYTIKYSFDKENWITYTNPIEIKKNVNVFACLENIVGQRSNYTNMEITIIDKLNPEDFEPSITTGSKSITINASNAKDAEATKEYGQSGIEEIWYSKDNGNTWQTNEDKTATSYTYDNLEQNTTYLVQVKVIDKAKNETITQAQEVTTETVTVAEGNVNISGPSWNASTHKASVTISKGSGVSNSLEVQYQVVTSLSNVTENGWSTGTSVGSINHNDYVCARLWDGVNGGSYTSQQIQDSQPPEVTVSITGKSSNSITASVSAQDNQYGMAENPTYTFYIKKTEEADTTYVQKQSGTGTTCTITGLEQNTSYTVKVTTSDIAGNLGAGTDSDTTTKQLVTEISLNKTSTTIQVGATETLTATITPSNAYDQSVTWNSSNTTVATVTNGTITAKATGTTTITATAQDGSGKSATCIVTVELPYTMVDGVPVPKGFTHTEGTKETGFVIKDTSTNADGTPTATNGNEYVWVPVDDTTSYSYDRYAFTRDDWKYSQTKGEYDSATQSYKIVRGDYYYTETMKRIDATRTELDSVNTYKGYYIGRYEVGVIGYDTPISTKSDGTKTWTGYSNGTAVVQKGKQVWNYITSTKAREVAESMYSDNDAVISRLCSSYAWDTALKFIETQNSTYPTNSVGGNYTKTLQNTGYDTTHPCNIYDMGGNVKEWTTEMYNQWYPSERGGFNYESVSDNPAAHRAYRTSGTFAGPSNGFRTTLFL